MKRLDAGRGSGLVISVACASGDHRMCRPDRERCECPDPRCTDTHSTVASSAPSDSAPQSADGAEHGAVRGLDGEAEAPDRSIENSGRLMTAEPSVTTMPVEVVMSRCTSRTGHPPKALRYDRNVAECVKADGGCGQKWVLDPKRGWQRIVTVNKALFS